MKFRFTVLLMLILILQGCKIPDVEHDNLVEGTKTANTNDQIDETSESFDVKIVQSKPAKDSEVPNDKNEPELELEVIVPCNERYIISTSDMKQQVNDSNYIHYFKLGEQFDVEGIISVDNITGEELVFENDAVLAMGYYDDDHIIYSNYDREGEKTVIDILDVKTGITAPKVQITDRFFDGFAYNETHVIYLNMEDQIIKYDMESEMKEVIYSHSDIAYVFFEEEVINVILVADDRTNYVEILDYNGESVLPKEEFASKVRGVYDDYVVFQSKEHLRYSGISDIKTGDNTILVENSTISFMSIVGDELLVGCSSYDEDWNVTIFRCSRKSNVVESFELETDVVLTAVFPDTLKVIHPNGQEPNSYFDISPIRFENVQD